jgi:uncharacterized protein YndB with AHSA1/START domain
MNEQPGGRLLELSYGFDASPERIFSMMTEPVQLVKWWGPRGFTTPHAEVDLTLDGGYRLTMQPPDGELFHLSGEFLEINQPNRLVYTFRWDEPTPDDRETIVTLSVEPAGHGSRVSLSQGSFTTEERLALHRSDGWMPSAGCARSSSAAPEQARLGEPAGRASRESQRSGSPTLT